MSLNDDDIAGKTVVLSLQGTIASMQAQYVSTLLSTLMWLQCEEIDSSTGLVQLSSHHPVCNLDTLSFRFKWLQDSVLLSMDDIPPLRHPRNGSFILPFHMDAINILNAS